MATSIPRVGNATHVLEGLEHLDQGITIFDENLKLIAWNTKFLEMYGYPESLAFVGADFSSFIEFNARMGEYGEGDVDELVGERVRIARKFLKHRFERTRRDGSTIEVVGSPLPNGGFVTTYTDISESTRQRQALQRSIEQKTEQMLLSEERLRLIADEVPAGIAHIDREMNILYANKRFAGAYLKTPAEIIGLNAAEILPARTLDESSRFFEQSRRGVQVDFEMRIELPGGRFKDVRTLLRPEKPSFGTIMGFYLISIDVTRRKSTMSALMRAQKMDALGRMASGISHDFNNLLTIILGNLVPLSEQLGDQTLVEEFLVPSISAARRGSSLTKRLLTLARREQFDPVPTEIGEAVEEICKLLSASVPDGLEIVQVQDADLPNAVVDRAQLEMALLNLALNARDATGGTGTITIECTPYSLTVEEAEMFRIPLGDYVRIRFSDNGCGMSPDHAERIFEPFFTSKVAGSGSGLGLSMVYGFVQQSNGAICVESAVGKGATFTILLPSVALSADAGAMLHDFSLPDFDEAPAAGPEPALATEAGSRIVLLVEDDPDVRRTIRRKIASIGYPLVEAGDADEAINLLDQVRDIGIVISDIDMPGERNGIDLARHVRASFPAIQVVLMSGKPNGLRDASPLPDVPFLRKPFGAEQLEAALGACAPLTARQAAGGER
ncbi:MAG: PAS-domain containing protein [Hyphomicrobiales bacterium]